MDRYVLANPIPCIGPHIAYKVAGRRLRSDRILLHFEQDISRSVEVSDSRTTRPRLRLVECRLFSPIQSIVAFASDISNLIVG
jgi:hypothetical protein